MKTNSIGRALDALSLTKKLAIVTILGFLLGVASSQSNFAEAAGAQPFNMNYDQAQALANQVYRQTMGGHEVYRYDGGSPHERVPEYCAENCACFATKFATAFRRAGFDTKMVQLNATRDVMFIKARIGPAGHTADVSTAWTFHVVTMVRVGGRMLVIDPLILQSPKFEGLTDWYVRIKSPVTMRPMKF